MKQNTTQIVQVVIAGAAVVAAIAFAMRPRHHAEAPAAPADDGVVDVDAVADPTAAPPDVAAAPARATRTPSGLAYVVLHPGTGTRHPTPADTVSVHYTGWTTDGHMFDSSVARGQPAQFPLGHVIPGWTEGVQLMTEGEKVRFWIPGALAYDRPGGGGPPGAPHGTLVFDVELLRIL